MKKINTIIKNVRIVGVGETFEVIENGAIAFDGTGIRSIFEEDTFVSGKEQWNIIDGRGYTVLPGLIDSHVHLGMDCSENPVKQIELDDDITTIMRAVSQGYQFLKYGITTVRNLGTKNNLDLNYRDEVKQGTIVGPNVVASGMPIVITGGHCNCMALEINGVDEARKATRTQVKNSTDLIKIMATGGVLTEGNDPGSAQMELDEIQEVTNEARKANKTVAAHAIGYEGLQNVIEANVTTVEHGTFLDEKLISKMVEKNMFLVPTLFAPTLLFEHAENKGTKYFLEKVKQLTTIHKENVEKTRRAGVKIVAGTDAGTPFNFPGYYLTNELNQFIEIGMTNLEAIKTATVNAAECMNIDDTVGCFKKGYIADLIMVKGNPLQEIFDLKNVEKVFKNGTLVVESGQVIGR